MNTLNQGYGQPQQTYSHPAGEGGYGYGYGQPPPQQSHHVPQYSDSNNRPATDNMSGQPYDHHMQGVPLYKNDATDGASAAKSKFVVQGCKDVWAAVLFLILTIAVIVWGIYNYATYFNFSDGFNSNGGVNDENNLVVNSNFRGNNDLEVEKLAMWAGIGIAAGFACAILSLGFFYCCPKLCIIFANIVSIALAVGLAIWAFINGIWIAAAILLFFALLRAWVLYLARHMIPFSATLLKQATRLMGQYPAITFSNIIWMLLLAVWGLLLLGAVYPTIRRTWIEDSPNAGILFIVYLFTLFATYWTLQVVLNVCHVTTAGVGATWYFCGENAMPSNPTLHSAKRAVTTSFGSICFGSLLVAILQTIRALLQSMARSRDNNCCTLFCICIVDCILGCIQSLLELFNKFAFVFVAIYGCSYLDAARMTRDQVKRSIFAPLFNNALVVTTLSIFVLGFSVVMAVIAFFGSGGTVDDVRWEACVIATMCGLTAGGTMWLFFRPVDSLVTTIFVCLADEPNILAHTNPDFNAELRGEASKIEVAPPTTGV